MIWPKAVRLRYELCALEYLRVVAEGVGIAEEFATMPAVAAAQLVSATLAAFELISILRLLSVDL